MSSWFCLNLGDAMLADEALGRIQDLFRSSYAKAGAPSGMALFLRHESEGRLHCEVKLYFSPMSDAVARSVRAKPCKQPSRDGLSLLAGSEDAWLLFFPGSATSP
jgi:hypothetical protein